MIKTQSARLNLGWRSDSICTYLADLAAKLTLDNATDDAKIHALCIVEHFGKSVIRLGEDGSLYTDSLPELGVQASIALAHAKQPLCAALMESLDGGCILWIEI